MFSSLSSLDSFDSPRFTDTRNIINSQNRRKPPYKLIVHIFGAKLHQRKKNTDTFATLALIGCSTDDIFRTKIQKKTNEPEWNETFIFNPTFRTNVLVITIWEKDFLNESVYGKLKIDLSEYTPGFEKQFWHTLYQRKNNSEIIEDVGEVEIKISYTRKIPEQMILHYKFSDNFEFHCIVKDFSGNSNHGNLKNLESYDVSRCKGKNRGITFSGFNWIECETNPTREVYEFSISLWFKTKNISNDYALISTLSDIQKKRSLTMDKGRSKLKQTLSNGSINLQKQIEEHNKDKSLTKYTGFLISIKKNQMYDDEGRNIILPSLDTEEEWNRQDLFKNDDWNHLVITYSGTKLHEYVNGVLTDQWNCNSQPVGGGKRLQVGASDILDFSGFQGEMLDVRIYNFVLSTDEVLELYKTAT